MEQQAPQYKNYGHINDICLLGYGSIGRGLLPLIMRHFTFDNFTIVDPNPVEAPAASEKYKFVKLAITKENLKEELDKIFVNKTGFCVNMSIDTSSRDIALYCQEKGVLYIDTCKGEWDEYYYDESIGL